MTARSLARHLLLSALFCAWSAGAQAAEIYINDGGNITFSGSVEAGDLRRMQTLYSEMMKREHGSGVVWLYSDGGDIKEALSIGRFLRKTELPVSVSLDAHCFSSCLMMIAGSVNRFIQGTVGVHRPNPFGDAAIVAANTTDHQNYAREAGKIRAYFKEMKIPAQLSELMIQTPPGDTRIFSPAELSAYMLVGEDRGHEAKRTASEAKKYKLALAEYRRRRSEADNACEPLFDGNNFEEVKTCRENIITGAIATGTKLPN